MMTPQDSGNDNPEHAKPSIWLSFSGGGSRAALFHYGCLKRLEEVGLLGHIFACSATSGGALIAAFVQTYWREPYIDRANGVYIENFNWGDFERDFLALARRGVFGPNYLLAFAYAFYGIAVALLSASHWFHFAWFWAVGAMMIGVILHASLALLLVREKVFASTREARNWTRAGTPFDQALWAAPSYRRFFGMLVRPNFLRYQMLNVRAFKGRLLKSLNHRIFLTAAELNTGKEVIFSQNVIAGLDQVGCKELWQQYSSGRTDSHAAEIAQAVAASTAFPPMFKPVSVHNGKKLVGVFMDGGVLDNAALNVPKAFAAWINARFGFDGDSKPLPFRDVVSFVLVMDGGKPPVALNSGRWSRSRGILRLLNILVDQQFDQTLLDAKELGWHNNIDTAIVGMSVGFPGESIFRGHEVEEMLGRIRTHMDGFSLEECAVVAYCGYQWTQQLLVIHPHLTTRYARVQDAPLTGFSKILPESCGEWDSSPEKLCRHLRYSNRQLGFLRWIGRNLGV